MSRKRFNLSINLCSEDGKMANEILSKESNKSDFVIKAINAYQIEYITKSNLKETLMEVIGQLELKPKENDNEDLDDDILDLFIH